jgi:hypothetical protein
VALALVFGLTLAAGAKPALADREVIMRTPNGCGGYDFSVAVVDDNGDLIGQEEPYYSTCSG